MTELVSTPFLQIELSNVRSSLQKLADYGRAHALSIRPHTKTHKSLFMARMQVEAGAVGLTAAKVGEAEVMAEAHRDILLAYPAADAARARRVAELARRIPIRVAIDTAYAADALAAAAQAAGSTVGVLVDLDVGMHRTGVASPQLAAQLAEAVSRQPALRLDGIFCYPGHIRTPSDAQAAELAAVSAILEEAFDLWQRRGFSRQIVSGGSTPTAYQSHQINGLTEIRPGTYIYNDMNCVHGGYCSLNEVAAHIVVTVVSDAVPGKIVIDAGSKTLTMDGCFSKADAGHGYVVEYPQAKIVRLSEEHGEVDITRCDRAPAIGERLHIVPNHICPCVNLQDRVVLKDGDRLEPLQVDTRGMLT